ncbi:DUF1499 domain-containing protein [Microbulbifer celer]|uniref:DUF1499 domain-containing protein n=1 Tax=Microbulbifer celer TaxID=435905 RepID=A0ABW3UBH0_9GAMM|nr:DUF1499 domain-containing protein [Microbulbifer celer]UFN59139.1 DUF1499 domain-containing protein [Microbulbifer celer]
MLRSGRPRHWSRWLYRIQWLLLIIIGLVIVAVRLHLLGLKPAYALFQAAGLAAIGVALASMLVFLWGLVKRHSEARTAALWAMVLGLIPVAVPLFTVGQQNLSAPAIYDISTDLESPPEYDLVLSLRREGDHSPAYPGATTARVQRSTPAYKDIQPLILPVPPGKVMAHAEAVARELGWRVIAVQVGKGKLEAVDRTPILGISEDIVVRVRPLDSKSELGKGQAQSVSIQSRVDMRSASRSGEGDLGSNAQRIRTFLGKLRERVELAQ